MSPDPVYSRGAEHAARHPWPFAGSLITFEGVEGAGKSTQLALLEASLVARGLTVRRLREPGGTGVGSKIRSILLDPETRPLAPLAELLLFQASRAQLVAEVIRPALDAGDIVLCDRFFDSSTVYQGCARGLPLADVEALNRITTGGLVPRLTLLLDLPPAHGLERVRRRAGQDGLDRFEQEAGTFHERVRQGFLSLAAAHPERICCLDARLPQEVLAQAILARVDDELSGNNRP